MKAFPLATLVSDLHLSSKPPVARSAEPDWFDAQARTINQLKKLARGPILCAGDIFDYWKASPELINFALDVLPEMHCIPGQHDLPFHNYADINKSAYGTLARAGKIHLLPPGAQGKRFCLEGDGTNPCRYFCVYAFPWGFEITPPNTHGVGLPTDMHVAITHAYIWQKGSSYTGAKDTQRIGAYKEALKGYDVALFGDNHKGFLGNAGNCIVYNHGGFMRRKIDEQDYEPTIGWLMSDHTVQLHKLDTSEDKWLSKKEAAILEAEGFKMAEFLQELDKLGAGSLDFKDAVQHYIKTYELSKGAEAIILAAMERHET